MPLNRLVRRGTATLATVLLALVGVASNAAATSDVETLTGTITPVAIDHQHGDDDALAVAVITTDDGSVVPVEVPPALEDVAPGTEIVARVINTPGDEPAEIVAHNIGASPRAAPVADIHRYYTVIISDPGNSSSHETNGVNVANSQAGQYWVRESRGVVTAFDANAVNRKTITRSDSCSLTYDQVWELGKAEFPGITFTGNSGNHLVVWSPSTCSYPYAGLATVGAGLNYGGMVHMVSGEASVLVHELGHNFGLGHSNAKLPNGTIDEYYGLYSPQAMSITGVLAAQLDAAYQDQLQVPGTAPQRQDVPAGGSADVSLHRVGSTTGLTALTFMGDNGKKHYVEYRDCEGHDQYALCGMHAGYTFANGVATDVGVVMYYVDGTDLVYLPIGTYGGGTQYWVNRPYTTVSGSNWSLMLQMHGGGLADVSFNVTGTSPTTPPDTGLATTTSVQVPESVTEDTVDAQAVVTVSASSPVSGDVAVSIGSTPVGTAALTNGTATVALPRNLLTVGTYTVTARYAGVPGQFEASTGTASITVTPGLQVTTTSVTVPPTVEGRVPNATVRVTSTRTVTGTVTVLINGNAVATAVPLSNGQALVALPSGLGVGAHIVTARYNGVANAFSPSNGTATLTVTAAPPTGSSQALTVTAPGVKYGTPATVTVTAPAGLPSGTIDLYVNGKLHSSASLTSGVATFRLDADLAAGSHLIEAKYRGFSNVTPATGTASLSVEAPPRPTVMVDAPDTTYGTAGWVTINLTAPGLTPQGTVELLLNGKTQTHLTLAGGVARYQFSALLSADTYVVEARYAGNKQFGPAQGQDTMIVAGPAVSTTTLQDHVISYGQTLDLPIEVTASAAVSGSAQVYQGTKLIGTTTVTGGKGTYKLPTSTWGVGTHKVTVKYLGTTRVTASSATATITVGKGEASITARATGLRVGARGTVVVTAVGAGLQTPTGKVTVLVNGTPVSSAVNLTSSGGKWTATVTTNVITAPGPVTISYTPTNTLLKSGVFATTLAV